MALIAQQDGQTVGEEGAEFGFNGELIDSTLNIALLQSRHGRREGVAAQTDAGAVLQHQPDHAKRRTTQGVGVA
ncbi:hypothetical protein D3C72_2354700 [compost metagenome]